MASPLAPLFNWFPRATHWQVATSAPYFAGGKGTPTLLYDDATITFGSFYGKLPEWYDAGDFTLRWGWYAASAITGDVRWRIQLERWEDDVFDIDVSGLVSHGTEVVPPDATTASVIVEETENIEQATQGFLAGESFRLRMDRVGNHVTDTMVGDAYLVDLALYENA